MLKVRADEAVCVIVSYYVVTSICRDLSFNNVSVVSKRWLYGLNSLQRLYVVIISRTHTESLCGFDIKLDFIYETRAELQNCLTSGYLNEVLI